MGTANMQMKPDVLAVDNKSNATILQSLDKALKISMKSIIICITIMASFTMLLQVVARYIFEVAISGLDEITGHTAVWLYLMGAAYGAYDRSQIKAEMIHLVIKNQRVLNGIRSFSTFIGAVVAGFMTTWSFNYVRWSIVKNEVTPTLQLPTVIFQIAILIGAVLMVFYFIREAIDYFRLTLKPEQAAE